MIDKKPYTPEEQELIDVALAEGLRNMMIPDHPKVKPSQDESRPIIQIDVIGRRQGRLAKMDDQVLLSIERGIYNDVGVIIANAITSSRKLPNHGDDDSIRRKVVEIVRNCLTEEEVE